MGSLVLNGTNAYAMRTSALVTQAFSFFAWGKLDTSANDATGNYCAFSQGVSSTIDDVYAFGVEDLGGDSDIDAAAWSRRNTWTRAQSAAAIVKDVWIAYGGTWTSNTSRAAYVNGGDKGTDATSMATNRGAQNRFGVGARFRSSISGHWYGKLAHAALWNIALSDTDHANLGAGALPSTIQSANLVAYYPGTVVDISGTDYLEDVSGNGNHLELFGGWSYDAADDPLGYVLAAAAGDFRFSGGAVNLRAQRLLDVDASEFRFSGGDTLGRITRRLSVDAADFRFQGGAVGLPLGRVLRADAADFRFSGGAMSLEAHRRLAVDAAEFRFQGAAVDFSRSYRVAADAGDFRIMGGAVGFGVDRHIGIEAADFRFAGGEVDLSIQSAAETVLEVEPGDLRFQGGALSLRASRRIDVAAGDLRFSGADVETLAQRRLSVEPGNFRINGMAVDLIAETSTTLGADAGVFTFTGADVSLLTTRRLVAAPGALTFTGGEVELSRDRVLKVQPGHFRISGGRARLIYSGAPPATGADRGGVTSRATESIVERVIAA